MEVKSEFGQLQLGVAGILGTPIAAAILLAWNLRTFGFVLASLFLLVSLLVIGLIDLLIGKTESLTLGVFSFLGLLLSIMLLAACLKSKGESRRESWTWVVLVVLASNGLALIFRIVSS